MSTFPRGVICETSTVADGNMDFRFEERDEVIAARTSFLLGYGIDYTEHIAMRCDHGEIITLVESGHESIGVTEQEKQVHSEVLVTQAKGLALMLFTADCQPVSFFDPVTETIALAHISRKTLALHLPLKTVQFLKDMLAVDPSNLMVEIGPHIKKESYTFTLPLTEASEEQKLYTEEQGGLAHIDLVSWNLAQLAQAGIILENISISPIDTGTSKEHYSYYMMKKYGEQKEARMATILMME